MLASLAVTRGARGAWRARKLSCAASSGMGRARSRFSAPSAQAATTYRATLGDSETGASISLASPQSGEPSCAGEPPRCICIPAPLALPPSNASRVEKRRAESLRSLGEYPKCVSENWRGAAVLGARVAALDAAARAAAAPAAVDRQTPRRAHARKRKGRLFTATHLIFGR